MSSRRHSDRHARRDPSGDRDHASEMVAYLIRGAVAFAARQFVRSREKRKKERRRKERRRHVPPTTTPTPTTRTPTTPASATSVPLTPTATAAAAFTGAGVGVGLGNDPGRESRPRHRSHRENLSQSGFRDGAKDGETAARDENESKRWGNRELIAALDGLSGELHATLARIRNLVRQPPRHRDCEVYRELLGNAETLQVSISNLQASTNNIRNLHEPIERPLKEGAQPRRDGLAEDKGVRQRKGGQERRVEVVEPRERGYEVRKKREIVTEETRRGRRSKGKVRWADRQQCKDDGRTSRGRPTA